MEILRLCHEENSGIILTIFDKSTAMNSIQRTELIESYGKAYDDLTEALKTYPKEMWLWKPAPEKWSIHEIVIHIADSEVNSYIRCRRFIAEPGSGVYGYDENKWATELDYHSQSIDDALELFRMLRHMTYKLIRTIPNAIWETATVQHSESGTVTFEQWLKIYEEHIPVHIRQMERTFRLWQADNLGVE
jgi:hypothetical protein